MKIPELLAPAGNLVSGIVAFENGADAVYCGLKKFSARDRAENFSFDDLSRLMTYAHERKKKVYVALNTLVKESEIPEAAKTVAKIAELGADAIIVQDLGIVRIAREYFHSLPIHASTQMAIHNSASAKIAKELGIARVILERQLTLDEIRRISEESPLETEIFIHGALCCSLSGQCLLSSWIGGYSGNRGKCKQACRFPASEESNDYPLSTRDLCMTDSIFALKKMKIASLKIEGRLRSTDYISNVVSAYRILLDAPEKEHSSALNEAKRRISLSCGRGSVQGFKQDFSLLINPSESGSSGIRCGEVRRVDKNGFFAYISGKLHLGDKIRVQKDSGASASSFTVKSIILGRDEAKSVRNGLAFIPCDRQVQTGDAIYKIGESSSPDSMKFEKLPLRPRTKVDFKIHIQKDSVSVFLPEKRLDWRREHHFSEAKSRPIDKESLSKLFSESASEIFCAGEIDVEIDGGYFTPISELKQIRREFWAWLAKNVSDEDPMKKICDNALGRFFIDYEKLNKNEQARRASASEPNDTTVLLKPGTSFVKNDSCLCVEIEDFKGMPHADEVLLPSFIPEDKLHESRMKISSALFKGIRRFRVSSLAHFAFIKDNTNLLITASFPLQCANSMAACEFRRLGATKVQIWPELERTEIDNLLSRSPVKMEIFRDGRLLVFYTRASIKGDFCEVRGMKFPIIRNSYGLSILLSPQILEIPNLENCVGFHDLRYSDDSSDKSSFNFNKEWK
ncbi:MAG TPA: U32 family peptidase [Victivallales bacterium]|nr:U32 family peptidase [Victivallales bacterium]